MDVTENSPPENLYQLRLTVRDEQLDNYLARLSEARFRQYLPDFLYVYSDQTYTLTTNDRFDGVSQRENELQRYRHRVNAFNRNTFNAGPEVSHDDRRVYLQVSLGIQAASEVLIPPFEDAGDKKTGMLNVHYKVPGQAPVDSEMFQEMREYLQKRPRQVYDELAVVTGRTALTPIIVRSRKRPSDILQT